MRPARTLLLLLLIALLPHRAIALLQLHPGWTKLMVWMSTSGNNRAILDQAVSDAGGEVLWRYEAATLVYVPESNRTTVTARMPGTGMYYNVIDDHIHLPGLTVDPMVGLPPGLPRITPYPAGQPGMYIVQFIGPTPNEWRDEVVKAGGSFPGGGFRENTAAVAATPEQMAIIAASPHVQFVDFMHPFEKGADGLFEGLEAERRYDVHVYVANAGPATDAALASIQSMSEVMRTETWTTGLYSLRIRGRDIRRLPEMPLVVSVIIEGASRPETFAVVPRDGAAGAKITISGEYFEQGAGVLFGDKPSPHVEVLGTDRIRAEVPAGLPAVPLDLLIQLPGNRNQIFPAGGTTSFRAAPVTSHAMMAPGDILTADTLPNLYFEGARGGQLRWLDTDGTLFMAASDDLIGNTPFTLFIDPSGVIVIPTYSKVLAFNANGDLAGAGPAWASGAMSVTFDRAGNVIVFKSNQLTRYSRSGAVLNSAAIAGAERPNAADLDTDQCTLLFTQGTAVKALDVCTNQPLPALFSRAASLGALRILPDRTLLITDSQGVYNVTRSGEQIASLALPGIGGFGGGIGIAPDMSRAAVTTGGAVRYFDLATRTFSTSLDEPNGMTGTLAVYGGWWAARGTETYSPSSRRRAARP
jgi:hypothetical protein